MLLLAIAGVGGCMVVTGAVFVSGVRVKGPQLVMDVVHRLHRQA